MIAPCFETHVEEEEAPGGGNLKAGKLTEADYSWATRQVTKP